MYAKLINNDIQYAPHYLIIGNQTILNPQSEDYIKAGYKPLVYEDLPKSKGSETYTPEYVETDGQIIVNYKIIPAENEMINRSEEGNTNN